jgi:hypothetical protein
LGGVDVMYPNLSKDLTGFETCQVWAKKICSLEIASLRSQ